MPKNANSPQRLRDRRKPPGASGALGPTWTDEDRQKAIQPLLNVARTEELIASRAAEVGTTSRTLHRWIAAAEGRTPGSTKLKVYFPGAALFVVAEHSKGTSIRAIHRLLLSEWPRLHPGRSCPCYSTLLAFVRSLPSASKERKP